MVRLTPDQMLDRGLLTVEQRDEIVANIGPNATVEYDPDEVTIDE